MNATRETVPTGVLASALAITLLTGAERRHLFICGSDSQDPAEIAGTPSATLRVVEVAVPGAGTP